MTTAHSQWKRETQKANDAPKYFSLNPQRRRSAVRAGALDGAAAAAAHSISLSTRHEVTGPAAAPLFGLFHASRVVAHAVGTGERVGSVLVVHFQVLQDVVQPIANRIKKFVETVSTAAAASGDVPVHELLKEIKNIRKGQLAALLSGNVVVRVEGRLLLLQIRLDGLHEAFELLRGEIHAVMGSGLGDDRFELLLHHHRGSDGGIIEDAAGGCAAAAVVIVRFCRRGRERRRGAASAREDENKE